MHFKEPIHCIFLCSKKAIRSTFATQYNVITLGAKITAHKVPNSKNLTVSSPNCIHPPYTTLLKLQNLCNYLSSLSCQIDVGFKKINELSWFGTFFPEQNKRIVTKVSNCLANFADLLLNWVNQLEVFKIKKSLPNKMNFICDNILNNLKNSQL